jgi:hypothetical protein
VKSLSVTLESFQPIPGRHSQCIQSRHEIKLIELAPGNALQILRTYPPCCLCVAAAENILRAFIGKCQDHNSQI